MAQDETNVDTPSQGSNLSVEEAFFSNNEGTTTQSSTESTEPVEQVVMRMLALLLQTPMKVMTKDVINIGSLKRIKLKMRTKL